MAEDNIKQVPFTATTEENSWVTFSSTQPDGVTVISNHEIKSVKSVKNIRIVCAENPTYKERTDKILFEQDESHNKDDITVTQTAKACDCDAFVITINDTTFAQTGETKQIGTIRNKDGNECNRGTFSASIGSISVDRNGNIVLTLASNTGDSRDIDISYAFNGDVCEEYKNKIRQNGINCDCNSVSVSCISTVIPANGTTSSTKVASISYSSTFCVDKVTLTATSSTQGVSVSIPTDKKSVFVRVGKNEGTETRNIAVTISYSVDGIQCSPITLDCITQEGQEPIVCGCNSITNVKWNTGTTTIPSGGTSNYEVISSFTVSQGCDANKVSAITDVSDATATVTNGKVYLNVGPNDVYEQRTITVKLKYENIVCDKISNTFTQEAKEQPVIECCTAITISNINQIHIPNSGIDSSEPYIALNYSLNTSEGCSMDNVRIEVNVSDGSSISWTSGNSQVVFTNLGGYYNIGERNITVNFYYENDLCTSINDFIQDGCECVQTVNLETILNATYFYTFAHLVVPKECKDNFTGETGYNIDIYYHGTDEKYPYYENKHSDRIGFEGEHETWIFNTTANFSYDEDYEYEDEEHEETYLDVRVTFGNGCSEITQRFHRQYFDSSYLALMPLMYEYGNIDEYPYSGTTSGVSTVYAPVGYLVSTSSTLTVDDVINSNDFVSFNTPATDMVFNYMKEMEAINVESPITEYNIEDNIWPVRKRRHNKAFEEGRTFDDLSGDIETFIATNQFFYDYNERLSYKQEDVISNAGSDLLLDDYIFNWDKNSVDTDDPFCSCDRPYGERCQVDYSDPESEYFCTFKDVLMELARKYPIKNDSIIKNNYLVLVNNENLDVIKKYVYVIYGQGMCYKHTYYYGWLDYIGHQYIPKNSSNKQFANNLKLSIRPLHHPQKSTYYTYANYINVGTDTLTSNPCKSEFKPKGSFSGASSFDDVKTYGYKNEYYEYWDMIYNVKIPASLNNTVDIANKFANLPFNTYHYKDRCFNFNGDYELKIAAIDSATTTSFDASVVYNGTNITDKITNLFIRLSTLVYDSIEGYWHYAEYCLIDDENILSLEEGTTNIGLTDFPLFTTINGVRFECDGTIEGCEGETSPILFDTNVYVNKKLKNIIINCTCENQTLTITNVEAIYQ